MREKEIIVVWFSCGAASAVAAKLAIEKYKETHIVRVVNNPIADEDKDNLRFLCDIEKWLGQSIEFALNPKYPNASCEQVWADRKFMSSPYGAPCTLELKKKARQHFEQTNQIDWHILGFTLEEKARFEAFKSSERDNTIGILIDESLTKQDCFNILMQSGIELPRMYKLGYPNANCPGCVKATSPTYWNLVREKHPEIFRNREILSRAIGAKLVRYKGKRIFLDELPEKVKAGAMKKLKLECGIFCDIHPNVLKFFEKDVDRKENNRAV